MAQAVALEIAVWELSPRDAVPVPLMVELSGAGGLLLGAYDGTQLVGIAFALPARTEDGLILWSHMTGVHPNYQGQGIGLGLKLRQREWALANGYREMGWTFDPLQRGNANFNLHHLGATAKSYHVNFYGAMQDGINRADLPSDRIEALWLLRDPEVEARIAGSSRPESAADVPYLLRDTGKPVYTTLDAAQPTLLVQIPATLARLTDFNALLEWRLALRQALTTAFAQGYHAADFVDNAYVLKRHSGQ